MIAGRREVELRAVESSNAVITNETVQPPGPCTEQRATIRCVLTAPDKNDAHLDRASRDCDPTRALSVNRRSIEVPRSETGESGLDQDPRKYAEIRRGLG